MMFRKRRQAIYQEPNVLESVAQYHHLLQLPILASPALPSRERCELQVSLLQEELQGLKTAINHKGDGLAPAANALANFQYAIGRALLEFGMGGLFMSMFDEVHRSHMSKICNSLLEAEATQRFHKGMESVIETVVPSMMNDDQRQPQDVTATTTTQPSKWIVLRSKDHKILKSVNYTPANLAILLTRAMEAAAAAAAVAEQSASSSDSSCGSDQSSSASTPLFFLMASPGALSSVAEYQTSLNGSSAAPSSKPHWPSKEGCRWRLHVLESKLKKLEHLLSKVGEEAVQEGGDAMATSTLIQVAHCLTNIQYSLSGAVLEFGMASVFQFIFDEVHRSRMSEACESVEEAQETIQHYMQRNSSQQEVPTGTIPEHPEEDSAEEEADYESSNYYFYRRQQPGTKWLVYRKGNDQALKSVRFTPANLERILIASNS
ncbi:MAG: hypothetical protein SGBAC_010010 [Bacillariaceae sp.]